MWTVHKEDKHEKGKKMAKMDKAQKTKKRGENINKVYHAFLYALTGEDLDEIFFSKDNGLDGEASGSDDEADDGFYQHHRMTGQDVLGEQSYCNFGSITHHKDGVIFQPHILWNDGCHGLPDDDDWTGKNFRKDFSAITAAQTGEESN